MNVQVNLPALMMMVSFKHVLFTHAHFLLPALGERCPDPLGAQRALRVRYGFLPLQVVLLKGSQEVAEGRTRLKVLARERYETIPSLHPGTKVPDVSG